MKTICCVWVHSQWMSFSPAKPTPASKIIEKIVIGTKAFLFCGYTITMIGIAVRSAIVIPLSQG